MYSYSLLCTVTKANLKKENLAAVPAEGFFLDDDQCKLFDGLCINLVPPILDFEREFKISSLKKLKDKNLFELKLDNIKNIQDLKKFEGRSFLIDTKSLPKNFTSDKNNVFNCINKIVLDRSLGEVGKIVDIIKNSEQLLLVVDHKGEEVYIPYVNEIVKGINDSIVDVDLPSGLLDINK